MKLPKLPFVAGLMLYLLVSQSAFSQDRDDYLKQLAGLGLQDLLNQEITSVLKKEQPIIKAASAIYVLTSEDIRRSGASSVPEALRLVPGITVARRDSNTWEITARGFDSQGSAKLLVLLDGRTLYSPLYLGVFWDVQDVVLEDIERIEVIRGPGSVTWGENAVNGVVNIITKKAKDTQDGLFVAGGGKEERGQGVLRYGEKLSEESTYRVFTKYFNRGDSKSPEGDSNDDSWDMYHGGFRLDTQITSQKSSTLQGDIYTGKSALKTTVFDSFEPPFSRTIDNSTDLNGGNLLFRYHDEISEDSQFTLQTYYDRTERDSYLFGEKRDTFDLDLQHHYRASDAHDLVYGTNIRISSDEVQGSNSIIFKPVHQTDTLATAFIQDEISIVKDTLSLIPGTKVGYNNYTGFEYQPAIKSSWSIEADKTLWSSISKAVRLPARIDDDVRLNGLPSVGPDGKLQLVSAFGNNDFRSEDLLAYEIGFRAEPSNTFQFDIATYYHKYDDLFSVEPKTPFIEYDPVEHTVIPFSLENLQNGDTYGVEFSATWKPLSNLSLTPLYSFTEVKLSQDPESLDTFSANVDRRTPHNQAGLSMRLDLPFNIQLDPTVYYVDSIPGVDISSYIRTDVRLGWKPKSNLDFDLIAQNLFDGKHAEYGAGNEIERAVYGKVTYRFR